MAIHLNTLAEKLSSTRIPSDRELDDIGRTLGKLSAAKRKALAEILQGRPRPAGLTAPVLALDSTP